MTNRPTLLALSAITLLLTGCNSRPESQEEQPAKSIAPAKGLVRDHAGDPIPQIEIRNGDDDPATLAGETGEPMLVNLWATWCAPCVKELPTLQALGDKPGMPRVIAVSQDLGPRGSIDAFLEKNGLAGLEVWHDAEMELSGKLDAQILPTTIYYDAKGREQWRYVGDLDWTSDEAIKLLSAKPAG